MASITPLNSLFHASIKAISTTLIIILLNACGGGGGSAPAPTYTVGGTISGFSGGNLVLQNNLTDDLIISNNGSFSFSTSASNADDYAVTVLTQPDTPNQICVVSSGNGTVASANITDVNIVCTGSAATSVFVSPAVIHNAITQTVRIHSKGLTAAASQIRIQSSLGTITSLSFVSHADSFNVITATVPAGLDVGSSTIYVTDSTGLDSTLTDGLLITDNASINLTSISKSSISNTTDNDLDIVATSGLSLGTQVYIQSGANPATQIDNKYFIDASRVRATIPAAMAAGLYSIIVVDASGNAGLLADSLTVNASAAPVITNISQKSLITPGSHSVTISGENFDTVNIPGIEIACLDDFGAINVLAGTLNVVTTTSVNVTFDVSSLAALQTCHINLTSNTGMTAQSGPLSVLGAALNSVNWSTQPNTMNTARSAAAMSKGDVSPNSRYLYVIGGDDVNKANAMSSVESLALQTYDVTSSWQTEQRSLPAAKTNSGAINIGQFVYVVGGYDGSSVVNTVYRAKILSQEESPDITSSFITLNDANSNGLAQGIYYYRIAATYPSGDTSNPSGESTVGRTIEVEIPNTTGAEITLDWETITGADGYRIYRSPTPNGNFSSLELLATTSGGASTRFSDTGLTTTAAPVYYEGSLGVWHAVSALNVARENHAVAVSPDPDTANQFFIYAIGGKDGAGTYLDSYEYATVTVASNGSQTTSAWVTGVSVLTNARAELKTWFVAAPGEYWIYAGPGADGVGPVANVDAFRVSTTGALDAPVSVDSVTGGYKGYTTASGSYALSLHGGAAGIASTNIKSTALCLSAAGACEGPRPHIENWNISGVSLNDARIYACASQTGANVFVAGGIDGTGAATSTVERANK